MPRPRTVDQMHDQMHDQMLMWVSARIDGQRVQFGFGPAGGSFDLSTTMGRVTNTATTDTTERQAPGNGSTANGDAGQYTRSRLVTVSRAQQEQQRAGDRARQRKLSKWDQPPVTDDWRFYVGTLGKVLIATGLLMFGFVAYQLWGTGIETARAQSRLDKQVAEQLATVSDRPADVGNVGIVEEVDATEAVATPGDGRNSTLEVDASAGAVPVAARFDPAEVPTAPAVPLPPVVRGNALFVLEAPAIDMSVNVLPGVDVETLKDGPGHYPETPLPGQLGNASVAGHRTTHGAPFFDTGELKIGDELIVTMLNGDRFVYTVASTEVVGPDDYYIVTTRDPTVAMLTLTTCTPKYTSKDRLAIHAVLDPERSAQVTAASRPYRVDTATPADSTADATLAIDDPVAGSGDATAPSAVDSSADDSVVTATGSSAAASDENLQDAFNQGWFTDRAAFPQIAFWGAILILIALFAYAVSRAVRHDSVGLLVGVAPFVVALYFFFENVNRLLPPGL